MDAEKYIERLEAEVREDAAEEALRRSLWEAFWKQRLELEEMYALEGPES